jgi:hypothetical protein
LHYKHNIGVAGERAMHTACISNKTALLAYRWTTFHSSHTLYTIIISSEEGLIGLIFIVHTIWAWFYHRQSGFEGGRNEKECPFSDIMSYVNKRGQTTMNWDGCYRFLEG